MSKENKTTKTEINDLSEFEKGFECGEAFGDVKVRIEKLNSENKAWEEGFRDGVRSVLKGAAIGILIVSVGTRAGCYILNKIQKSN
jgi:hypothetical protein